MSAPPNNLQNHSGSPNLPRTTAAHRNQAKPPSSPKTTAARQAPHQNHVGCPKPQQNHVGSPKTAKNHRGSPHPGQTPINPQNHGGSSSSSPKPCRLPKTSATPRRLPKPPPPRQNSVSSPKASIVWLQSATSGIWGDGGTAGGKAASNKALGRAEQCVKRGAGLSSTNVSSSTSTGAWYWRVFGLPF